MNRLLVFTGLLLISFGLVSCFGDDSAMGSEEIEVTEEINDVIDQFKDEPVVETELPPVSEEKENIIKEKSKQSPFVNLGCCQDVSRRADSCCYKPVLQKFQIMLQEGNPNLGEYKATDPILGACRQAIPKAFEAVEDEFYADDDKVE